MGGEGEGHGQAEHSERGCCDEGGLQGIDAGLLVDPNEGFLYCFCVCFFFCILYIPKIYARF